MRFIINNGLISVYKYKVTGTNNGIDFEDMALNLEYANFSRNKFEEIGCKNVVIENLETSDIDWMDGIKANTIEEAQAIYENGQDAYLSADATIQMQLALAELAEMVLGGK